MRPLPAASGQVPHQARAHAIAADQPVFGDLPKSWLAAARGEGADGYEYLLLLRFALTNAVAFGLLGVVWLQGWIDVVLAGDSTRLVLLIAAVFAAGLVLCGRKVWQTSVELNQVRQPERHSSRVASYLASIEGRAGDARAIIASALRLKLAARIAPIRHIANSLVFLGLIGTVIGFIIALSGVDPKAAADVNAVGAMVSTLISGMSVALHTTLVGAVLNLWLMANYRLLESGTVRLVTATVELGERHARS
jgi:biopolymer transport protein ExbB/TolQ